MASVLAKVFERAKAGEPVRLFKSHRDGIADGEQRRDFIYVEDAVAVLRWLLDRGTVNGIFNVGTGKAESFRDMITAMFAALKRAAQHRIRRHAGERSAASISISRRPRPRTCAAPAIDGQFTPLANAVERYVTGYLDRADRYR